jgi:IclR family acetate operon transcriptional repressor
MGELLMAHEDAGSEPSPYSVRAAERVADLLDSLQAATDGLSLVALAAATGMPKSSVFRYLATLESRGYVEKDGDTGNYSLGPALPSASRYYDVLATRTRPVLERLRDRFEETANFAVLDGDRVVYVQIVESARAMRLAARRGDHDYAHSTAVGKAIAAQQSDDAVRTLLRASGMPARTPRTITRVDDFMDELARVREQGYAIDDEENEQGARCVAVALTGTRVAAGISISAPAVRLSHEQAQGVAKALSDEARRLSRRLAAMRGDE